MMKEVVLWGIAWDRSQNAPQVGTPTRRRVSRQMEGRSGRDWGGPCLGRV